MLKVWLAVWTPPAPPSKGGESFKVRVISAVPVCPAAGVMVRMRLAPSPVIEKPGFCVNSPVPAEVSGRNPVSELGIRAGFEELKEKPGFWVCWVKVSVRISLSPMLTATLMGLS